MGHAPTAGEVGNVKLNCVISLTVSCCLRQPREGFSQIIAAPSVKPSGGTRTTDLTRMITQLQIDFRVPRSGSSGRAW